MSISEHVTLLMTSLSDEIQTCAHLTLPLLEYPESTIPLILVIWGSRTGAGAGSQTHSASNGSAGSFSEPLRGLMAQAGDVALKLLPTCGLVCWVTWRPHPTQGVAGRLMTRSNLWWGWQFTNCSLPTCRLRSSSQGASKGFRVGCVFQSSHQGDGTYLARYPNITPCQWSRALLRRNMAWSSGMLLHPIPSLWP